MSNFFEKSDLSRNEAENIISDTLQKCDDGELYLENSKSETILLDDNKSSILIPNFKLFLLILISGRFLLKPPDWKVSSAVFSSNCFDAKQEASAIKRQLSRHLPTAQPASASPLIAATCSVHKPADGFLQVIQHWGQVIQKQGQVIKQQGQGI